MKIQDKDKRLCIEVWDYDKTSHDDFLGSLSFGLQEILKKEADGWYILLVQEVGKFYCVPAPPEDKQIMEKSEKFVNKDDIQHSTLDIQNQLKEANYNKTTCSAFFKYISFSLF